MGIRNLSQVCDIVVADTATAAGTTAITSDAVNVQGADSVLCIVSLGAITSTGTCALSVTESTTSGGSYTPITGATASATDADGETVLMTEIIRPKMGFIKIVATRAVANVVLKGIYAIVQRNGKYPTTQTTAADTATVVVG